MRKSRQKTLLLASWAMATVFVAGGCSAKKAKQAPADTKPVSEDVLPASQPEPNTPALAKPVTEVCEQLPGEAKMLAHIDLQGVGSSPLWARNRARMEKEPDTRRTLEAMEACKIPFSGLKSLDLALAPISHQTAIVVRGSGVGDQANLSCIRKQLADMVGPEDFVLQPRAGSQVLVLKGDRPEDEMLGYLVDANTLVLATKPWSASWAAGFGKSAGGGACAGDLVPALARVNGAQPIWFAGTLPPNALPELAPEPGSDSGITSVTGALGLKNGLAIELQIGLSDASKAKSMTTLVQAQLDQLTGMAKQVGVPEGVLDSVALKADGSTLVLTAAIDMQAIAAMEAVMAASLGQAPATGT